MQRLIQIWNSAFSERPYSERDIWECPELKELLSTGWRIVCVYPNSQSQSAKTYCWILLEKNNEN